MKKKVIVAGHICLDITPVFPDGKVKSVEQVLSPGKLIQMGNADVHTGGAVANTGLAMKLLGADVSLMGKVGEDAFGDMILNILDGYDAKEGMSVIRNQQPVIRLCLQFLGLTGFSFIIREQTILLRYQILILTK